MLLHRRLPVMLFAMVVASNVHATAPDAADQPIQQFLAQDDTQRPYRAVVRRLAAQNGGRKGWIDVRNLPDRGCVFGIDLPRIPISAFAAT